MWTCHNSQVSMVSGTARMACACNLCAAPNMSGNYCCNARCCCWCCFTAAKMQLYLVELVRQRQREPFRLQEPSAFSCCVTCAAMAARGAADICCYGGGIPPRCVLYAVLVQHACTEQAKKATAVSRRVRRQPEKSQGTPVQALRRREGSETKKSACRAKAAHSAI